MSTSSSSTLDPALRLRHPAWLEIDGQQMARNLHELKQLAAPARTCIMVKANAYGHGLVETGRLVQQAGMDALGVVHLQEARMLREAGISLPIMVLGPIHDDQLLELLNLDVEVAVSSHFKARLLHNLCAQLRRSIRIHLEIETGMQRTGMRSDTALALIRQLPHLPYLIPAGIYSHFATADMPDHPATQQQLSCFQDLIAHPEVASIAFTRHMANSAALLSLPEAHFDLVRPGLLAYGYNPFGSACPEAIRPCLSLRARVAYTKIVPAGASISYGHRYTCAHPARILTIPVGYGDGYSRALSSEGTVLIRGKRFPIVGTICMDQFMVNAGDEEIKVGEEVVLLGQQGDLSIDANDLAAHTKSISWEILSRFTARLPRVVIPPHAL